MSTLRGTLVKDGDVTVDTNFPGGNPRAPDGLELDGPGRFVVRPFCELPGSSTYKERVEVRLTNASAAAKQVELIFDWGDASHLEVKDHVYVGRRGAWRLHVGAREGNVVRLVLSLPPGETWLCKHPMYVLSDLEGYIARLKGRDEVSCDVPGQSAEKRPIHRLRLTDPCVPDSEKRAVLITTRQHPYETAGSFCAEGMVDFLLGDSDLARFSLGRFVFHVLPMPNPDGVEAGLCRNTRAEDGANVCELSSDSGGDDPAVVTLRKVLEEARPCLLVSVHNWQRRHIDGYMYSDPGDQLGVRERFETFMPSQVAHGKLWRRVKNFYGSYLDREGSDYVCRHAVRGYGARFFVAEFPWFERTEVDMRKTGRAFLQAVLRTFLTDDPETLK